MFICKDYEYDVGIFFKNNLLHKIKLSSKCLFATKNMQKKNADVITTIVADQN